MKTEIPNVEIRFSSATTKDKGRGMITCSAYFNVSASPSVVRIYESLVKNHRDKINAELKDYLVEWRDSAKKDKQIRIFTAGNTLNRDEYDYCAEWMFKTAKSVISETIIPLAKKYYQPKGKKSVD